MNVMHCNVKLYNSVVSGKESPNIRLYYCGLEILFMQGAFRSCYNWN